MTIVQINSVCGWGSTGRIAVDIAHAAEGRGHTCYIAYGHGSTTYPRAYRIGNRLEHLFHNLFFTRILGLHGYGSIITTWLFTRWLDRVGPDVIHIHNIHANYINYKILFNYIIRRKLPVVFTLHDCFNFTGKCTNYTSVKCSKYISGCTKCTNYNKTGPPSLFFDFSSVIWRQKKLLYSRIPRCTAIAVSQWLKGEAEQSMLAGNGHIVDYIYNWVDYVQFEPASDEEKKAFALKHGLEPNARYLVSVSQEWNKNTIRCQDAERLARILPPEYRLILVGKVAKGTVLSPAIIHIPYIAERKELSVAFSMAKAYVHFSIEDTFGLVIAEAMACGTVPITYDSTACAEVPGGYGIIVPPRSVDAIVASLPLLEEKKEHREEMMAYVRDNYDKRVNTNKYVDVYEKYERR